MSSNDLSRARELAAELRTLADGAPPALSTLVPQLPLLLGADYSAGYGVSIAENHLHLDFMYTQRLAPAFVESFRAFLEAAPVQFGFYNPALPEPAQRNRAVTLREAERITRRRSAPLVTSFFPHWGLEKQDMLRILVCDGPQLLAWVGVYRADTFRERERNILATLADPLLRRLQLEKRLGQSEFKTAALAATLAAVTVPAFIVDAAGSVVEANALGRQMLETDRRSVLASLLESIKRRDDAAPFSVAEFSALGMPSHYLAFGRAVNLSAERRVADAARRWALTRRQAEVLALLARGLPNKTIAGILRCAERTVELHVSSALEKAGESTRAALVARLWNEF